MWNKRLGMFLRMTLGSVLGIVGFGMLSLGFVQLSVLRMGEGVAAIVAGTALALGVMAPLRKPPQTPPQSAPEGSATDSGGIENM